jgi:formamidopyrimidine-DNA glycosylase
VAELPDVEAYLAALAPRVLGTRLERVRLASPFVLRSVDPPPSDAAGKAVTGLGRLGKRIVIALAHRLYLVIHPMIAGRLRRRARGARVPERVGPDVPSSGRRGATLRRPRHDPGWLDLPFGPASAS